MTDELEWLKERYIRNRRFRVGTTRGILLASLLMVIDYFFSILPWETPKQRGFTLTVYFLIMITSILSAHWGKFKYDYETDLERLIWK